MPRCQHVSMSSCQHFSMSACHHFSMSACQYANMPRCQHVSMSSCQPVSMSACLHVSSHHLSISACQHVNMATFQHISMSACQHVSMSACQRDHPEPAVDAKSYFFGNRVQQNWFLGLSGDLDADPNLQRVDEMFMSWNKKEVQKCLAMVFVAVLRAGPLQPGHVLTMTWSMLTTWCVDML